MFHYRVSTILYASFSSLTDTAHQDGDTGETLKVLPSKLCRPHCIFEADTNIDIWEKSDNDRCVFTETH